MSVSYVKGDLLKATGINILVHGCDCFCTMGSGIAKQIAKTYPQAEIVDKATTRGNRDKLGTITIVNVALKEVGETNKWVINAYTQYSYGTDKQNLDYDALRSCLKMLDKELPNGTIGMPKMGCGLGLGDWEVVKLIIEEELGHRDVTVFSLEGF